MWINTLIDEWIKIHICVEAGKWVDGWVGEWRNIGYRTSCLSIYTILKVEHLVSGLTWMTPSSSATVVRHFLKD